MDVGEITEEMGLEGWVRACPAGSKVDGYQVIMGVLIYQIRPRCSCVNCGTILEFSPRISTLKYPPSGVCLRVFIS